MNILWGDLHNHCGITYGVGSLENAIKNAKLQLDFGAFTGHAMWPDMYEKNEDTTFIVNFHLEGFEKLCRDWNCIRDKVAKANTKDFVAFQGYEMHSCEYGDYHLIAKDDNLNLIYRNSPKELLEDCGCEAMAIPHHIGYTPSYRGINWDKFDHNTCPIVEVYSKHGCSMSETAPYPYYHDMGPRDTSNTVYAGIRKGKQFGFVASTDHHAGFPGSYGDGMVAVLAKDKTREAIWEALKARRTYAVTGDKIACEFKINNHFMGETIIAKERHISYNIKTDYWLDKIIVYKNLKPFHIINGEAYKEACQKGKYKIRVEMGWGGKDELFTWKGQVKVEGGSISDYRTYFRGRNVLSPTRNEDGNADTINAIDNSIEKVDNTSVNWTCQTVRNKSTLHPMTNSVLIEVSGDLDTKVNWDINGREETHTIRELLNTGYTSHMKPYHSHAFKIHQAIPETQYTFSLDIMDTEQEQEWDVYHIEVSQKNNHYAFISPIFVSWEEDV